MRQSTGNFIDEFGGRFYEGVEPALDLVDLFIVVEDGAAEGGGVDGGFFECCWS